MIYLIESGEYYKIGYAENLKNRCKNYNTHNPNYAVIDTMEGNKLDEKILHKLCKKYHEKLEWFTKCKNVLMLWEAYKYSNQEISNLIIKRDTRIKQLENHLDKVDKHLLEAHKMLNTRYAELNLLKI